MGGAPRSAVARLRARSRSWAATTPRASAFRGGRTRSTSPSTTPRRGKARPGPWASLVAYRGIAGEAPAWIEGLLAARITVYGAAGAFGERFYLQPESGSGHDDVILRFPGMQDEAWLQQGPMRRRLATRIQFMPTPAHAQPGTVRWRWDERGETIWSYCPSASCWVVP